MISAKALENFRRFMKSRTIAGAYDAMPRHGISVDNFEPDRGNAPDPRVVGREMLKALARRLSPRDWAALQNHLCDEGEEDDRAEDNYSEHQPSIMRPDRRGRMTGIVEPDERDSDGPPAMDSAHRRRARSGFDALFPGALPVAIA